MPRKISSKADLVGLVKSLALEDKSDWENGDLSSYLKALAAWLDDCEGFYSGKETSIEVDQSSWQIFADAIQASAVYE